MQRGRKPGTSNKTGHKAGGARPGAGRKRILPVSSDSGGDEEVEDGVEKEGEVSETENGTENDTAGGE